MPVPRRPVAAGVRPVRKSLCRQGLRAPGGDAPHRPGRVRVTPTGVRGPGVIRQKVTLLALLITLELSPGPRDAVRLLMKPPDWRPPTLTTERLVLRAFEDADAEPLFVHASNPNVTRFTLWDHHKSINDTLLFVRDYARCRYLEGTPEPY